MAGWLEEIISAARQNTATINTADSKVVARIETDTQRPVRDERVLLVQPSGETVQRRTDDDGVVRFEQLQLPPGSGAYLVLPDVLESWNAASGTELYLGRLGAIAVETMPADLMHVDRDPVAPYANLNKDAVDKLTKASAPGLDDAGLELVNQQWTDEKDYRSGDTTKYLVATERSNAAEDQCRLPIRIDRLSEAEKFEHFQRALEDNNAWYHAGRIRYDQDHPRYTIRDGAVCNQFANFFLGYWYNHGAAMTWRASSTDFLRLMENESENDAGNNIYSFRGFADVTLNGIETPAGMNEFVWRHSRVYRDGTRGEFSYIRIEGTDLVENGAIYTFANADLNAALASINVYSISDGIGNDWLVDHHGGLLLKDEFDHLSTFAADGYRGASGYSHDPIIVKSPARLRRGALNNNLHLRIWPLLPLRNGGYAPLEEDRGNYVTDAEMRTRHDDGDVDSVIDPDFRHALPRFVYWVGNPNP